jgi:hypothetical protein
MAGDLTRVCQKSRNGTVKCAVAQSDGTPACGSLHKSNCAKGRKRGTLSELLFSSLFPVFLCFLNELINYFFGIVPTYSKLDTVQGRFLALCGVMFEKIQYENFQIKWEALKRQFFHGDPDEPIILHRKELMSRNGIFSPLEDDATRHAFDAEFLKVVEQASFKSVIVVIDKARHQKRYLLFLFCLLCCLPVCRAASNPDDAN